MERFPICERKFDGKLDIPVSSVNVESYICSDLCFRSLKRFDKLQEDAKTLYRTLNLIS